MEPEPEPDLWVQPDPRRSPALQRVAGAGLQSHLQPTVIAVVDLKGDLGLTIEPRTNPAPPPAPPCRVKTIRPGSPASKAVPPIKAGDWIVSVQGQHVGSYFAAMNRINTAPVRPALSSTETLYSAANTRRPCHDSARYSWAYYEQRSYRRSPSQICGRRASSSTSAPTCGYRQQS